MLRIKQNLIKASCCCPEYPAQVVELKVKMERKWNVKGLVTSAYMYVYVYAHLSQFTFHSSSGCE